MAIKSSGSLALSEIQTEWLGSNPIGMSEYYGDGDYLPDGAVDGDGNAVPESGALDISDFYDTSRATDLTISSNTNNYNIATATQDAGGDLNTPVNLQINSGVTVGSTSTGTPAMITHTGWGSGTTITIVNQGSIVGASGANAQSNPSSGGGAGGQSHENWSQYSSQRQGGAGQNGSGSAGSGQQGGDAFTHSQTGSNLAVVFDTAGTRTGGSAGTLTILGNGGGGGAGGNNSVTQSGCVGGGGGGGAAGGSGGYGYGNAANGQAGGNTSGGSGGGYSNSHWANPCFCGTCVNPHNGNSNYKGPGGAGGAGGGLGQAGSGGASGANHAGGSGGSAGSNGTSNGQAGAALAGNTDQIS